MRKPFGAVLILSLVVTCAACASSSSSQKEKPKPQDRSQETWARRAPGVAGGELAEERSSRPRGEAR
jgi:hypothetical protein